MRDRMKHLHLFWVALRVACFLALPYCFLALVVHSQTGRSWVLQAQDPLQQQERAAWLSRAINFLLFGSVLSIAGIVATSFILAKRPVSRTDRTNEAAPTSGEPHLLATAEPPAAPDAPAAGSRSTDSGSGRG
jgi:hypothetical protein